MGRKQKFTAEQVVTALRETKGMVYQAAALLKCDAATIYNYCDRYASVRNELEMHVGTFDDIAESKLLQAVEAGAPWAIVFRLKTKARNRGYSERVEVTGADGGALRLAWAEHASSDDNTP